MTTFRDDLLIPHQPAAAMARETAHKERAATVHSRCAISVVQSVIVTHFDTADCGNVTTTGPKRGHRPAAVV